MWKQETLITMTGEEEKRLIYELSCGSYDAFDTLYMQYSPLVEKFALALLKNRAEMDDISQNIFLKLWEIREKLTDIKSLRSYLFIMTRNAVMDAFARRKVVVASSSFPDTVLKDVASEIIVERIDSQNLMIMVEMAVSVMPEQRRKVFTLSRKHNLSHKEIAERMGISVKTVEYHISKALSSLRSMLKILIFFI